jgi:hypothetical protein
MSSYLFFRVPSNQTSSRGSPILFNTPGYWYEGSNSGDFSTTTPASIGDYTTFSSNQFVYVVSDSTNPIYLSMAATDIYFGTKFGTKSDNSILYIISGNLNFNGFASQLENDGKLQLEVPLYYTNSFAQLFINSDTTIIKAPINSTGDFSFAGFVTYTVDLYSSVTVTGTFDIGSSITVNVYEPDGSITYGSPGAYALSNANTIQAPGGGGDPHIKPVFGAKYLLENREKSYTLFDNMLEGDNKLVINAKCWFLPVELIEEYQKLTNDNETAINFMSRYTFFRYISVICGSENIVIDLETLQQVEYTSDGDVDKFNLCQTTDEVKLNNIKLGKILNDDKGLYSVNFNTYKNKKGTTTRYIHVKNSDCEVSIKLSMNKDIDDRNAIILTINGKRKMSPFNYKGAFIQKGNHSIKSLID